MATLFNDIKFGIRMLCKQPGLTLTIVLVLSLGISVSVAIYGFADWFMCPPSPFPFPDRIVHIQTSDDLTYLDYLALRDQLNSLSGLATVSYCERYMTKGQLFREYKTARVSRNFFSVTQVQAHLGQLFSETDSNELKNQNTVVLSHRLWKSQFGSDPTIIGRSIIFNYVNTIVLGIAPPRFRTIEGNDFEGSEHAGVIDFWIPDDSTDEKILKLVGCLKPGVTVQTLRMETKAAFERLKLRKRDSLIPLEPRVESDHDHRYAGGFFSLKVMVLIVGVANVILLIACLNVSGLLLAKADARRQEMAVRRALGGSLGHLIQQLLTEGAVLAILALGTSILLTYWIMNLVRPILPENMGDLWQIQIFNPRIVGYSLSISLLGTFLFELVPIWCACRTDLIPALKADRSHTSRRQRRSYGMPMLVVSQLSVALILLVCAGLLLRSLVKANSVDILGFQKKNVLKAKLGLDGDTDHNKILLRDMTNQLRTLPGVKNVGLGLRAPTEFTRYWREYEVSSSGGESFRDGHRETIRVNVVDPGYFPTVGIPILRGQNFSERVDPLDSRKVIINETFASRLWPGKDPVGRFIQLVDRDRSTTEVSQVVGMVSDIVKYHVGRAPDSELYIPLEDPCPRDLTLLVKTQGDPRLLADPVSRMIRGLGNTIQVNAMTTLAQETRELTVEQRLCARLVGLWALAGMGLASIGLYGIVAFTVSRRTRELGIHMALGAQRQDVMRMVMVQGLKLSLIGSGLGLIGSLMICRILRTGLHGISPFDPIAFAGAAGVLIGTALLACYMPARRAARIDPMEALRYE
ncbi:MAG: ABC transporter permease [Sedimentisphaerales bacterium]